MKLYIIFLLSVHCLFAQNSTEQQAEQYIKSKRYVDAVILLKPYLKHTQTVKGIELLGDAYSYQNNWDDAITQYKLLITIQPDKANNFYKYGGALSKKALEVNKLRAVTYLDDIESAFLKALKLDQNHINSHWALARYYMHVPRLFGGSKTKAQQHVEALLKISPVDGYLAKGHYFEDEKEFDKAEYYYQKAIEIGGSKVCYQHLIDLYKLQKDYKKAISTIDLAYSKIQLEEFLTQRKALESKF